MGRREDFVIETKTKNAHLSTTSPIGSDPAALWRALA
jgi:hypothetical protein